MSQLRALGTVTQSLVLLSMHVFSNLGYRFCDLDIDACIFKENVPIEIFNISFEKHSEIRKKVMIISNINDFLGGLLWF